MMGKRSAFQRRPMDDYPTIDPKAAVVLMPFLEAVDTFAEPCAGDGHLVRHLEGYGLRCVHRSDIKDGVDALDVSCFAAADAIITNPPWSRHLLHGMIRHFQRIAPTWLLFDADWAHTIQAAPFMAQCSDIVSIGRLKWFEGSKHTGKDNCAWYRFDADHDTGPRFHERREIHKGQATAFARPFQ
jgi:hypothetical protein